LNPRIDSSTAILMLSLVVSLTSVVQAEPPVARSVSIGQWERFEATLIHKKKYADPYADVRLEVTYTRPDGKTVAFWGFYDGDSTWKLRLMPDAVGTWKYQARFSDGSGGKVGEF